MHPHASGAAQAALSDREMALFQALIYRESGISLSPAKRQLVASRLARRLRALGCRTYGEYYDHIARRDPSGAELREMINCITTNKTSFFRESHHFDFLRGTVFAAAEAARATVRIWSAGCSTGEEPYTIAMCAWEHFGKAAPSRVSIVASDIDTQVLEKARRGVYAEAGLDGIPLALRKRWLLRGTGDSEGMARVRPEVRELVDFRQVNLIGPDAGWPAEPTFDVIFCRNVIIYFDADTRRRLIERFAQRLAPGGHLILGHSETMPNEVRAFDALKNTMFRRRAEGATPAAPAPAVEAPRPARPAPAPAPTPAPSRVAPRAAVRPPRTDDEAAEEQLLYSRIIAGGVFASRAPAVVRTLLGSCVAACLYDPVAGVGGMNHFMLPDGAADGAATRYGVHAMEVLINEIMHLGGDRRRLEAKAFGAASVLQLSDAAGVPEQNARFIKEFLATERIPLRAHRLGGTTALDVVLYTATGRALVRPVGAEVARRTAEDETQYRLDIRRRNERDTNNDVTLF